MSAAYEAAALVVAGALAIRCTGAVLDRADGLARRRLHAPAPFAVALADAAVPVDADDAWTGWLGGVVAGAVVAWLVGGAGLAAIVAVVMGGTPVVVLSVLHDRSSRLVDAALPDVLDGVARSLRSGATLHHALAEAAARAAGRLHDDVAVVVQEVDAGRPLVHAVESWAERCPTPGVRLAVAAMALSAESGGAPARAIDGVAATLRANLAVEGELRAQSSQARLSGLVIALAPLAFAVLAMATDGRTAGFLLRTPIGLACLAAGLLLDALAAWWMQRITAAVA